METKLPFNLGVTLYSFNIDYYSMKKSFEDLMATAGSYGAGTGVEIVFQQFDRNYPYVSDEFEMRFKKACEKNELVPTVFTGYPDAGLFKEDFYGEECLEYQTAQIRSARQLGFDKIRLSIRDTKMLELLLPYAEKYGVTMLTEIHCPYTPMTYGWMLDFYERMDSPYLGFFPDCGTMCRAPSVVYTRRFAEQGVPQEIIDLVVEQWMQKKTVSEIREAVSKVTKCEGLIELLVTESMEYFAHGEPRDLLPYMKYMKHVHGKFFYVDENGYENAVRVPEIVAVLKEGGFTDYISAEYEGHHWFSKEDAAEQVSRYFDLIRQSYAAL